MSNNFPKLHNAAWPGVVGKGSDDEPFFSLDKMIEFTANASSGDRKFDGIDLFISDPHVSIDSSDDDLYSEAVQIVQETKKTSISFLQRKLKVGYNRAANLIESMEAKGVLSAPQSNGNRDILKDKD